MKTVKLQHRKYLGNDKTEYIQHRINIPDSIIRKIGWSKEDQIILHVKDNKIILELKTKNV